MMKSIQWCTEAYRASTERAPVRSVLLKVQRAGPICLSTKLFLAPQSEFLGSGTMIYLDFLVDKI